MRYINPSFLNDGMTVWIDCRLAGIRGKKPGIGLKCSVVAAHGNHGLLENTQYKFRKLVSIWDMYVARQ